VLHATHGPRWVNRLYKPKNQAETDGPGPGARYLATTIGSDLPKYTMRKITGEGRFTKSTVDSPGPQKYSPFYAGAGTSPRYSMRSRSAHQKGTEVPSPNKYHLAGKIGVDAPQYSLAVKKDGTFQHTTPGPGPAKLMMRDQHSRARPKTTGSGYTMCDKPKIRKADATPGPKYEAINRFGLDNAFAPRITLPSSPRKEPTTHGPGPAKLNLSGRICR